MEPGRGALQRVELGVKPLLERGNLFDSVADVLLVLFEQPRGQLLCVLQLEQVDLFSPGERVRVVLFGERACVGGPWKGVRLSYCSLLP